jgi:hypothetical protein
MAHFPGSRDPLASFLSTVPDWSVLDKMALDNAIRGLPLPVIGPAPFGILVHDAIKVKLHDCLLYYIVYDISYTISYTISYVRYIACDIVYDIQYTISYTMSYTISKTTLYVFLLMSERLQINWTLSLESSLAMRMWLKILAVLFQAHLTDL